VSRRNQQTLCDASELTRVVDELPVNENRSAIGNHRKLEFGEERKYQNLPTGFDSAQQNWMQ